MAGETFKLKIVTPMGVAVEEQVTSVTVPSTNGEIGILPQHTQYSGLVGIGVLSYWKSENGAPEKLVVSGGFCQFSDNALTILADACYTPDSIDRTNYARERAELQKIVDSEDTQSSAWMVAREKLSRIEAIDSLL